MSCGLVDEWGDDYDHLTQKCGCFVGNVLVIRHSRLQRLAKRIAEALFKKESNVIACLCMK